MKIKGKIVTKEELAKRIKDVAYLEGDFVLRSGKRSKYYLDKYLFETCPDILQALGEEFAKHAGEEVTLIAGAELGGVALAASTAMASGKNWIIVRNSKKGYGTGKMVEGVLNAGDVVLLVEDIATTGGQVLEAAKIITEAGASVKKIVCVIDRKQGAEENITDAGFVFESILTKHDLGIMD
ncbi:MAG: orotate phosphoribosyltransferase [Sedimentisphaerales bacterium]|nr:orotate phosphoribosyltransferase [Sedimentisphaerales bacterium]